jgi:DTW domain-containing protein YfiP
MANPVRRDYRRHSSKKNSKRAAAPTLPSGEPVPACPTCLKNDPLCFCAQIKKLATKYHVLILQHPQEPDKELGTAQLTHLALTHSTLKIGLSWRNLSSVIGRETQNSRWAVLYLGSGAKTQEHLEPGLTLTDKNGVPLKPEESKKARKELEGIIVLDGTWSQAKTLWWRNAWLLKVRRAILNPTHKSLYGALRKEPRKECLSTIESVAEGLTSLGEPENVGNELRATFKTLLDKFEESKRAQRELRKTQTQSARH